MSNAPDNSILGKMTSRAAGKRQIKPTALLFETLIHENDSDEEDEDFHVKMDDNASEGSTNSESEEDEDEEESENEEENVEETSTEKAETSSENTEAEANLQICGVCINRREVDDRDDFMQCDNCKIIVHESCYGGIFLEDDTEEESKTTHWFCEPCVYGLDEPPFCEFCPSRYGAFKRSDVGGRWVHLTCALFTPGVSFSAFDILSGVSWQEIGNSVFGKRSCSVCEDKIDSRLGVSTRCESGMCRDYLHSTCAQKLGLLVDETDDQNFQNGQTASVSRYFYCKKHSHVENAKAQKKLYSIWEKQEFKRIVKNQRRKPLSGDEVKDRKKMLEKIEAVFTDMTNVTINIPTAAIEKSRRARYLNTSAEFFDKFASKAEDRGMTREEFRKPFFDIQQTNTMTIPIGFSNEFMGYLNSRENVIIPEEEERIKKLRETLKITKERHFRLSKSKEIAEKLAANEAEIARKKLLLSNFCEVLASFDEKNELLKTLKESLPQKDGSVDREKKNKPTKGVCVKKEPSKCGECEQVTDQHKMTECDQCHVSYHIGCLNPPLMRLPKRTATCGWICHECNESDEEEEEANMSDSFLNSCRTTRSRRPPARHSSFYEH